MSNKDIALDLDGVIADISYSIDLALERKGIENYDYSEWLTKHHHCNLSDSIMNNKLFWKNIKPFSDAWYQVNTWFSMGYNIHIVTARRTPVAIDATQYWLDGWRFSTMLPVFCPMGEKHTVVEKIEPLFMIEDNPFEVQTLIENGVNAYLRRAWYNREYWDELPSIGNLLELRLDD